MATLSKQGIEIERINALKYSLSLRSNGAVLRNRGEGWNALESDGLVRLRAFPETDSWFDVYGEPDSAQERQEIIDQIDRNGCWLIESEFYADGAWHHADSIGMCVYARPLDPTENWYVEDLMRAAIEALEMQSTEGALI